MRTEQILLAINIAREKSITKAAEMMFISQPNASIMLKSLEKELGFPLFRRHAGNIVLTEEGAEFIDYAISIERSLNAISQISKPVKHIDFRILTLKSDVTELAFERLCEKYSSNDYAIRLCYQVIPNTEDAARMIESGQSDIAIVVCRKNLFEAYSRYASERLLETAKISETLLYLTCSSAHPIIQSGKIRYELFEEYPAFTSIPVSSSDNYVPSFLTKYGITVKNSIVMDPCDTRYRLLQKMNGFLISIPISDSINAEYDLKSLPVEDSNILIFALYRKNPQKKELLTEYIQYCKELFESGMQSVRRHDSAEHHSTRILGRKQMGNHILENERLRITISDSGAELISVFDKDACRERLWQADPAIWNRNAPILFPFVGKLTDGKYRVGGREYNMKTQHGFARDMDFICTKETETSVSHQLTATDETMASYPYDFRLTIEHSLDPAEPGRLNIRWVVENPGDTGMLYAIGGHPAFLPPDGIKKEQCHLLFPEKEELHYFSVNTAGFAMPADRHTLHLDGGMASWQDDIPQTWIFENEGVSSVGLCGADGEPFVMIHCREFPILAVWANPRGPFICLEPWFGRTDDAGFSGTLEEKPGMQILEGHCRKEINWSIDFCK